MKHRNGKRPAHNSGIAEPGATPDHNVPIGVRAPSDVKKRQPPVQVQPLRVVAKNIVRLTHYNGQECEVLRMWRSSRHGPVSLLVRFADGKELSRTGEREFDTLCERDLRTIRRIQAPKPSRRPAALRRILRNSARSTGWGSLT